MITRSSSDPADGGDASASGERPGDDYPKKVGPFEVHRDGYQLSLRLQDAQGGFGWGGCLLFAFTMFFVLVLGVLSVLQTERIGGGPANPAHALVPTENHFGFLWLFSSLAMFVAVPLYVRRTYRGTLTFSFDRATDGFYRNNRLVCPMRRVECLRLCESHDPDGQYLYLLELCFGDGEHCLLHNGYEEREVMNLANEIASFTHTPVSWR